VGTVRDIEKFTDTVVLVRLFVFFFGALFSLFFLCVLFFYYIMSTFVIAVHVVR
jgi:hypothetical protein